MGANTFIVFYGIKLAISRTDEDTLDALETRTEPRIRHARQHGLHVYWGRPTDGRDYFLYIWHQIGVLGVENDTYIRVPLDKLTETAINVQTRLKEAGFHESPALQLQLEAQY
jgi:hypothetical protein